MAEAARFPASWKNGREIDVIIVNSFDNTQVAGLAKPPWAGKVTIISMRSRGSNGYQRANSRLAKTLAHEIGHFLGSLHADGNNIMR